MQISYGDVSDAAQTLQTVVKNSPNNIQAHYALGVACKSKGIWSAPRANGERLCA